jgi:hypothetical protein
VQVVLGGHVQIWSDPLSGLHEKPVVGSASALASVTPASVPVSLAASFVGESRGASVVVASLLPSFPPSEPVPVDEPHAARATEQRSRSRFMPRS